MLVLFKGQLCRLLGILRQRVHQSYGMLPQPGSTGRACHASPKFHLVNNNDRKLHATPVKSNDEKQWHGTVIATESRLHHTALLS